MVTLEEQKKLDSQRTLMLKKCSCGHTIAIVFADRTICSHCGKWVYRNKQIEFKYKLKEKMIEEAKNGNRSK